MISGDAAGGRTFNSQTFKPSLPVVVSGLDLASLTTDEITSRDDPGSQEESSCSSRSSQALLNFDDASGEESRKVWCGHTSPRSSVSVEETFSRCTSVASSSVQYAEPSQTLIFLDWDDTLFPTSELFDRWGLPRRGQSPVGEAERALQPWRKALRQFLEVACRLSDRCVILTNATRPWVDSCVQRFAPDLADLFYPNNPTGIDVVYAGETSRSMSSSMNCSSSRVRNAIPFSSNCLASAWQMLSRSVQDICADEHELNLSSIRTQQRALTEAKRLSMESEAFDFYSRYPGQTWKNVLSFGDMPYEHDAVREMSAGRQERRDRARDHMKEQMRLSPYAGVRWWRRERLRTKAIFVRGDPSLSEIALQLQLLRQVLEAFVLFDGDIDLDLREAKDPLTVISSAIDIPQLGFVRFPLQACGSLAEISQEEHGAEIESALDEVAVVVQEHLWNERGRIGIT